MRQVLTAVMLVCSILPSALCQSPSPQATDQLRAITEAIKKCPEGITKESNGSGSHFYPPVNVVWDVEHTQSYRSPEIGYIEFISDYSYLPRTPISCKKNDRQCIAWSKASAEADLLVAGIPTRHLNRYEFDFGLHGLEFSRALWRLEKDQTGQWNSTSLGSSCESVAVKTVLASSQQPSVAADAKQALALYEGNDYVDARPLLDRACDTGSAEACEHLGQIYDSGWGITQDHNRAAALFLKACNAGNVDGCLSLGVSYGNGNGVEQDYSRARELFSLSCDQGSSLGCAYLGDIYKNGYGVAQGYQHAVALYTKSCESGLEYGYGCAALGVMYQNGYGVGKDSEKSKQLYGKACRLGNENGCNLLKNVQ